MIDNQTYLAGLRVFGDLPHWFEGIWKLILVVWGCMETYLAALKMHGDCKLTLLL